MKLERMRVFLPLEKKIKDVVAIDFASQTIEYNEEGKRVKKQIKEVELIKKTTLRDKNQKFISEGDIVDFSFKDCDDINTRTMEVVYDGINFRLKELYRNYWLEKEDGVLKTKHGKITKYKGDTILLQDLSELGIHTYEIVGNVYLNKEMTV